VRIMGWIVGWKFRLLAGKSFGMWWPGTELNRRRQPFQGCALPPELPGHCLSAHLHLNMLIRTAADSRFGRALGALTERDAAKQHSRCAGTCRTYEL
jgi:hypothetical protein